MQVVSTLFLAIHAERLHRANVWQRTLRFAQDFAQRGFTCTFFVCPYRAVLDDIDLADRIARLQSLGHEIAQHTHFYSIHQLDVHEDVDDFTEVNVRNCIERDLEYLTRRGVVPDGFTAGAWAFPDSLVRTLAEHGFSYDCSTRIPRSFNVSSAHIPCLYIDRPTLVNGNRESGDRQMLLLPTTCSLGRWYKARLGNRLSRLPKVPLIYFHDYDLLRLTTYALAVHLSRLTRSYSVRAVRDLRAMVDAQQVDDVVSSE